jgi:hypothetical protein
MGREVVTVMLPSPSNVKCSHLGAVGLGIRVKDLGLGFTV